MTDQNDAAMSLPPQHFFEDNFPPNGLFNIKIDINKNSNLYFIVILLLPFNILLILFPSYVHNTYKHFN